MGSPRVSIICATYNGARFLDEAIASVLRQDFDDYELLLVDDGSTDDSPAIARSHAAADPARIRYLEHPGHVNRGASASRNLGLRAARGEFIAFIDSDDAWRPAKLRQQAEIMASDPAIGMLCGKVNYWSSWCGGEDRLVATGRMQDRLSLPPQTLLDLYPLGPAHAPCPSDVMVRRTLIEAGCTFEERLEGPVQMYEDQGFFVKLFLAAPVFFSSNVWLDYRQHKDSCVSVVFRDRLYEDMRRDFLGWLDAYVAEHAGSDRERIRRSIARARWELDHPLVGRVARKLRTLAAAARA